jgi:hypothetical protein
LQKKRPPTKITAASIQKIRSQEEINAYKAKQMAEAAKKRITQQPDYFNMENPNMKKVDIEAVCVVSFNLSFVVSLVSPIKTDIDWFPVGSGGQIGAGGAHSGVGHRAAACQTRRRRRSPRTSPQSCLCRIRRERNVHILMSFCFLMSFFFRFFRIFLLSIFLSLHLF